VLIKAVDNVNLKIKKGEFVSIVGHSGSGKTTLLSLIGGLTKPDRGKVLIDDTDIWTLSDAELSALRNQKIGFIFQFASLISTLSVVDNLMLPTTFSKETEEVYERAKELLDMVELSDKINSYPSQLSGGQQRRVAIARAFMNRPDIILADEPTGDLDEETEAEVMELFHKVNKKENTTFLMVTHSKDLASQAKKMLRMTSGRITEI
jgi:putative ABC transport system ATP-binding protein/lipoprotein-releasing system ATP-binding protein